MRTFAEYLASGWRFHHEQLVYDTIKKKELGKVQYFHKQGVNQFHVFHPAIRCTREKLFWSPRFGR